jgi:transposase InsO family protein
VTFNPDMFSDKWTIRRAKRRNQVWQVEVGLLDVPGRPRIVIAVDIHSRLPMVAAVTSGGDDIIAKLADACRRFGHPEEIWIDQSIEFTSSALKECAARHDVTIVFGPMRSWSPLAKSCSKLSTSSLTAGDPRHEHQRLS